MAADPHFSSMMKEVEEDSDDDIEGFNTSEFISGLRSQYKNETPKETSYAPQARGPIDDSDSDEGYTIRPNRSSGFAESVPDFPSTPISEPTAISDLDIGLLRSQLSRAATRSEGVVQCFVERDRSGVNRFHPMFTLRSETGGRFMLRGQKRSRQKTSNWLITCSETEPIARNSQSIVGKVRANFVGSSFTIYDHGLSPDKAATESTMRLEYGTIQFEYDKMGPGRLLVYVPKVRENGTVEAWRPRNDSGKIVAAVEEGNTSNLFEMRNKRPQWDEAAQGHVLNFHGRVTQSSIKNFQLTCEELGADVILQFGRVDTNRFTMDYRYPLSAFQAFAICLASLDAKMADSKTFDSIQKLKAKRNSLKERMPSLSDMRRRMSRSRESKERD